MAKLICEPSQGPHCLMFSLYPLPRLLLTPVILEGNQSPPSELSKHHPSVVLALNAPLLAEVKYIPNKI